jgi:hypothetical protein
VVWIDVEREWIDWVVHSSWIAVKGDIAHMEIRDVDELVDLGLPGVEDVGAGEEVIGEEEEEGSCHIGGVYN